MSPDARPLCPDAVGAAIVLGVLAGGWLGWQLAVWFGVIS